MAPDEFPPINDTFSLMAPENHPAKSLLKAALQKANNAVYFDHCQGFEDALRDYGEACALLGQVMKVSLGEEDKTTLEAIVRHMFPALNV